MHTPYPSFGFRINFRIQVLGCFGIADCGYWVLGQDLGQGSGLEIS